MPLLSIIIPVYNSEKTIRRTLDSLLALPVDSRRQIEVVIVDDGSTDSSSSIIASIKDLLVPAELLYLDQTNQGTSAARNTGLERATGRWIFFLDADDELGCDPVPHLLQATDASSIGFSVQYLHEGSSQGIRRPSLITEKNHLSQFTAQNALTVSSVIMRKDAIRVPFDPTIKFLEDWLFWIKNPVIFENMTMNRKMLSALIHTHGHGKTADQARNGEFRTRIAEKLLEELRTTLTGTQKNNLRIQSVIGQIQQGHKIPAGSFLRFPCNAVLYLKLLAYALLRARISTVSKYR